MRKSVMKFFSRTTLGTGLARTGNNTKFFSSTAMNAAPATHGRLVMTHLSLRPAAAQEGRSGAARRVVAVSGGESNSLALIADGAFFTWGEGGHGCLGHGEDLSDQLLPKKQEGRGVGRGRRAAEVMVRGVSEL